jgi:hypothetical protein
MATRSAIVISAVHQQHAQKYSFVGTVLSDRWARAVVARHSDGSIKCMHV